jgi:hypothetical protein
MRWLDGTFARDPAEPRFDKARKRQLGQLGLNGLTSSLPPLLRRPCDSRIIQGEKCPRALDHILTFGQMYSEIKLLLATQALNPGPSNVIVWDAPAVNAGVSGLVHN